MKVQFSAWRKIEVLKQDVEEVTTQWELPCDIEKIFEKIDLPKNLLENAYCSIELEKNKEYPVIVVTPQYFDKSDSSRRLILLHELIHACQRKNELHKFNEKFLKKMNEVDKIIEENSENTDNNAQKLYVSRFTHKSIQLHKKI